MRAPAKTVAAMRSAARQGGQVHVGITVTASATDGVVDTAAVTWSAVG